MKNSPLRFGFTVSSWTMVSRLLGMLRDIVFGVIFGGSGTLDAFLVAFKIPNFFRRITAEGAMTQALLPILAEVRAKNNAQQYKNFLKSALFFLILILGTATILTLIFPKAVSGLFAAGLIRHPELFDLTASMLRITFPYLFLITLTAYYMALQHSENKFRLAAQTPILLNVSLIGAALLAETLFDPPIMALAWGVLIAGVLQLLLQANGVRQLNLPVLPTFSFAQFKRDPYVVKFYRALLPAALSGSLVQINLLIDTFIASFLASGSISWLYFAERLIQLPIGVLGISLATVIMPGLSQLHQQNKDHRARNMLLWGIYMSLLLTLPAAAGLVILAKPILATLFYHGSFTLSHLEQTTAALRAYAIGVPAFVLSKTLTASFFARQDYKTPLKITAVSTLIGVLFSLGLVFFLRHIGLALATSISGLFSASLLFFILMRDGRIIANRPFLVFCGQTILAMTGLIIVLVLLVLWLPTEVWTAPNILARVLQLLLFIVLASATYFFILLMMGFNWRRLNPIFE